MAISGTITFATFHVRHSNFRHNHVRVIIYIFANQLCGESCCGESYVAKVAVAKVIVPDLAPFSGGAKSNFKGKR